MARIAFRQMVSGFFGGSSGGGGFNLLSMFGLGGGGSVPLPPIPMRAAGGSVSSGSPYIVGENGPELFMPSRSGSIIPDSTMSGGSGVVVNQTINISTGVQQTVRAEIQSLLPQISNAAKAAVIDAKRRGGSFANAFGG
jgi:phage-related minor tail protein